MKDKNLLDDIKIKSLTELTEISANLAKKLEKQKDLEKSIEEYQKLLTINNLIQKQIETITLANATPQYSLKILSEPTAPEIRIQPKRTLIAQFGLIFGLLMSFIFVLLKNYLTTKKN